MNLDSYASQLSDATTPTCYDGGVAPEVFGTEAPGRLGDLGQALSRLWHTALATHAAEVTAAAEDLAVACGELRTAAVRYAETDLDAAAHLTAAHRDQATATVIDRDQRHG